MGMQGFHMQLRPDFFAPLFFFLGAFNFLMNLYAVKEPPSLEITIFLPLCRLQWVWFYGNMHITSMTHTISTEGPCIYLFLSWRKEDAQQS